METENITPLDLAKAQELVKDRRIDYIVGSVHHVRGTPIDFDRPTWLRAVAQTNGTAHTEEGLTDWSPSEAMSKLEPMLLAYFEAQYETLQALKPDVVGHFDLCLLYTPGISLRRSQTVWKVVQRNVDFVVGYGGLFEANSAALRKGWESSYPSNDVLEASLVHKHCVARPNSAVL